MRRSVAAEKARELVGQMTVEEAAGQLRYDAPAIERLGIPAYNWWGEALHGVARAGCATSFPQAIALAASFDPALTETVGHISAVEGRAKYNAHAAHGDRDIYKGLTFWSPNINIFRDPRWGRGHETYGEDPYLTAQLGIAYVRGLQGDGPVMKAAACAKHFAVHSGPEALRHAFDATATAKDMAETYLPAFEALVRQADVEAVMGAYNRTNGEPCCASKSLMVDLLREEWGFEGHYVSDCWAIRDFHEHHNVTETPEQSAALALNMGCDLNCGNTYLRLMKALAQGLVTEEQIRTSAIRLFTTRYLLGIMEGEGSEYDKISYRVVECPAHLEAAHQGTLKSCVLLKNDGCLPLNLDKLSTIAVVGPNANNRVALVGNYHGTSSRYTTILEGIQDYVGDRARVLYSEGCHLFQDRVEHLAMPGDRLAEARIVAQQADVVIAVVGLDETMEGEEGDTGNAAASGDKADLLLPPVQRRLLEILLELGKPTVICLMAGSAIDLGRAAEEAEAILNVWYPGARGGSAVAELLFGDVSPSGKLPVTFHRNEDLESLPAFTDYAMTGRTYRYLEREPLYPFGYGLTYGDVFVREASILSQSGETLTVEAMVRNAGRRDTGDVVQVYVQNEGSPNAPKHPRLCAFRRVFCPAGEQLRVELSVPTAQLMVVDDDGRHLVEGNPVLYVAMGQPDSQTEKLTGHPAISLRLDTGQLRGF